MRKIQTSPGDTAGLENASRILTAACRFDDYGQAVASYPSVRPPANPFRPKFVD